MALEREWFKHDYGARNDPRLQKVQQLFGMEGIGIFWCLVEIAHEQGGQIMQADCESIAFALRTQCERITGVLRVMFTLDGNRYISGRVQHSITMRNAKSEQAKQAALSSWESRRNANAKRPHSVSNAIEKRREEKIEKIDRVDITPAPRKRSADIDPPGFLEIWARYPKQVDRKAAVKHYRASVITEQDRQDIHKALDNYLNSQTVRDGYIQGGGRWFNNWRDWINNPIAIEQPCSRLKALIAQRSGGGL